MDFCCSLLNGGVHLHVSVKHYKAICAPHPKSFRSTSPLQFILYKPPEGAGERKVTGEAQTAEGGEQPG
ncbi:Protein adenylyltransferase SelO [Dissostichus eleginoides]|uniref:Protein adenylyltransferase SelO n=1 Tax=Dissostichus eleginoides TaxID=100907 RepID=A0AAD9B648_DISEL|nr:Protein adenylyltransferase SelO [Dissostichus eleginoides]